VQRQLQILTGAVFALAFARNARADGEPSPTPAPPSAAPTTPSAAPTTPSPTPPPKTAPPPYTIGGYVEALYQWNFNRPSNDVTAQRGFDDRHNTFTLSNVALDGQWDYEGVNGRLTLQVGETPSVYYASEPVRAGQAETSGPGLWKYIQQAYAGYRFDVLSGLNVNAGIFLSPIGPEGMAVRDNWNWSRSNLFFALPFYHTGIRVQLAVTKEITLTVAGFNGWNTVVDNNDGKSVMALFTYTKEGSLTVNALYFGGPERKKGALEGQPWRSLFDLNALFTVNDYVSLLGHADAGFEPGKLGTSAWVSGALYSRIHVVKPLFVAARGDFLYERPGESASGTASSIFFGVPWVASGTATIEAKPHEQVSFRLEGRHDQAAGDLYYRGKVQGDGSKAAPFVPNARAQNTVTLGVTAWF
jgi:hypothetical protein